MHALLKMRFWLCTCGSFLLTAGVIGNAFRHKQQFYPTIVYLSKSGISLAVLYIQALFLVLLAGKLLRKIFFGPLRAAEVEHLIERSWYAVTETCLAFTVFRDDFTPQFVAMFTVLLFLKIFHWLLEDRIDFMERSPNISTLFHIRVITLLFLLVVIDLAFIRSAYHTTVLRGASAQIVFGFEYSVLVIGLLAIFIKYLLHTFDLRTENPWDNKAVYMLYTELITSALKLIVYTLFMMIMIAIHTFPLFAIRPMYLALRLFKKSLHDVVMSRRAIHYMNTRFASITEADLSSMDTTCIICREEMDVGSKRLPCNHVFHASCLRSWFQRQQTCPTCRVDILTAAGANNTAAAPQPQAAAADPAHQPMFAGLFRRVPVNQQANVQNGNGNAPNNAAPFFPYHFPFAPNLQAQQNQADNNGNRSQIPPGSFPWFPPPAFCPPPLRPNLSSLSDEEIRAMEGNERANVQARIECLHQIKLLLDSAVIQLQQYSSVIAQQQANIPIPVNLHQQDENSEDIPSTSNSQPHNEKTFPQPEELSVVSDPDSLDEPTDANELRKRRLSKLEKKTSNVDLPDN